MWNELPDATVQILAGGDQNEVGSGFHLRSGEIVVTNAHVAHPYIRTDQSVYARTESGEINELQLVEHSPADEYDFAVLETTSDWSEDRISLQPDPEQPVRGTEVLFSGYPLGYSELLVHSGTVSGPAEDGFSVDASVNKGNSGGAVVNPDSGNVLGIITLKGAVSPEGLDELHEAWSQVYFAAKNNLVTIRMGGIDQNELNRLIAHSFDTLNQLIEVNSSTGIGRAVSIEYVDKAADAYLS